MHRRCKIADLPAEFAIDCELLVGGRPCQVDVEALKGGFYKCGFTPTAAGFFRLNVTSCGMPLSNSPVSIKVGAALERPVFGNDDNGVSWVLEPQPHQRWAASCRWRPQTRTAGVSHQTRSS